MKNLIRRLAAIFSIISALMITFLGSSFTSYATESPAKSGDNPFTTNIENTQPADFIPFRSDYVKYITQNASKESEITQYVWMKLFKEELNWNVNSPWYNGHFSSWSDMYNSEYITAQGETKSSKGVQVTYNADFDAFLYQTVINNPEFVIKWINENPGVFKHYVDTINQHPIFAEAIIELTKGGLYLGDGKDSDTNVFLKGSKSTSSDKGNAAWSADATTFDTHDIEILKIFGSQYKLLNDTQKEWVNTYMEWMVNDYISRRGSAIAAPGNSLDLYKLMVVSGYGFTRSEVNQEFFNYSESHNDVSLGALIANSAKRFKKTEELRYGEEDMISNIDMGIIWSGDADCNYKDHTDWPGYRNLKDADDDYDWFCYQICFSNDEYYRRLKALVSGNETTAAQMQAWLLRYNILKPGTDASSRPYKEAVARSGQTISNAVASWTQPGCNASATPGHGEGFSHGAHWGGASASVMKPIGVQRISFGHNVNCWETRYSYRITDTATGRVLSSGNNVTSVDVLLPAKYTWSDKIQVWGEVRTRTGAPDGVYENVGDGSCDEEGGRQLFFNWTYTNVSSCDTQGHSYQYSYTWSADHSTCTAVGTCINCGDKTTPITCMTVVTEDDDFYYYTAKFEHTSVGAKTYAEPKTKGEFVFDKNSPYMSGRFRNSNYTSRRNEGPGFALEVTTQAMCSTKSGAIKKGAKEITVSASGSLNNITLFDKYSNTIESVITSTGSHTFYLEDYTDDQIEGMYIVINMFDKGIANGGYSIGQLVEATAYVEFNSVTVRY
ncbi:MAG: hypothetical protein K6E79_07565 [Pseudobutyrivibrio sp.]|nr:hypothetical protein [Pseudobutyrivibrio sp.]